MKATYKRQALQRGGKCIIIRIEQIAVDLALLFSCIKSFALFFCTQ